MSIEEIKAQLEVLGPLKVEFTPESDEGNSIIVPINDDYDGTFFTVIGCGDKQDNLGAYMALAVNELPDLISDIDRLQRENDELRPYKDELLRLAEAVGEKDDPFAAWEHLEPAIARAEAAEAEVKRLQAELALSKPLYSRRQIEARVKLLEEALKPVAEKYDSITPGAADVAEGCATHPDNMQDDQLALITLRIGDLRRARDTLASTGGGHHGN